MARNGSEWLDLRTPDGQVRRITLDGARLEIGRDRRNGLVLPHDHVSTRHAEIVQQGGQYFLRDLKSTNGTHLNGRPVDPDVAVSLQPGDRVEIGPFTLVYRNGTASLSPEADLAPSRSQRGSPLGALARGVLALLLGLALLVGLLWLIAPPRVSLLVLGSDARPDQVSRGERGRTDTLMTLVADRQPPAATLVSLPRDLWVRIPGFDEERINAAYALGGAEVAKRTVADVLGLGIDRYLLIGLQGVRDVVDAAGGIDVDVETRIHDEAYPTDDYRTVVIDIPAGRQHMDGETALRYARSRHQDTDFARAARQQRVLVALRNTMLQPKNWGRTPAVLDAVRRTTRTDLAPLDLVTVAFALLLGPGEPERLVVGPGLVEPFTGAEGAALLRATPGLRSAVAASLSRGRGR